MPLSVGQTLKNRYRVESLLGHGGMAEVYKVEDLQRGVPLAMKVLHEELSEDRVFLRRFQREAQNLASLQHPNIVRFYGLEQDGPLAFILMDYIEGQTLRRVIFDSGGPLPMERVLAILQPVCSALNYAHQQGIVHCDLKSSNIMVDKNDKVYLTDFGIARMTDMATSTLIGAGTPAYMAPELILGKDPTPQSDIYALGVVLFEMLTGGERPFTGERADITGTTAEKVRWEHLHLDPTDITKCNLNIPGYVNETISHCLEKNPEDRFQTIGEFNIKLNQIIPANNSEKQENHEYLIENINRKETQNQKTITKKLKWWVFGLGILLLCLILFLGKLISKKQDVYQDVDLMVDILPTQKLTPTLIPPKQSIEKRLISGIIPEKVVFVPAGEFVMGSDHGGDDEKPAHLVYIDAFWIDQNEVTNAQYRKCVEAGYCFDFDFHDYYFDHQYDNFPVVNVDFRDAEKYCQWAGRRLPTEAEWEKAARGTDGRTYPWGEGIDCSRANYHGCTEFEEIYPVGYFGEAGASPYGAYDMAGNVWEWVADYYSKDYYSKSPYKNPIGPENGDNLYQQVRGGSWTNDPDNCRSFNRYQYTYGGDTNYSSNNIGFRCVMDANQ